jgi:hypothetical protein
LAALASARLVLRDVEGALEAIGDPFEAVRPNPDTVYIAVWHLATLAALRGLPETAARLVGFAKAEFARQKEAMTFVQTAPCEILTASLAAQLSNDQIERLENGGARLAVDQVLQDASDVVAELQRVSRTIRETA